MFILILNKLLFFLKDNLKNIIIIFFLIFYSYLTGFTPSILRVVISFIIATILNRYDIKISPIKKLFLSGFIIILIDPFNVYSTSFLYSFTACLGVIYAQNRTKKNYIMSILVISFYTLLFTMPITISLNYEINLILFISNLLFIPYVSFYLYPLGLLTFLLPVFMPLFNLSVKLMEKVIIILDKITILQVNIPKMPFILIIIFYILLYLYVRFNKKKYLFIIIILIIGLKIGYKLDFNDYIIFFDVGQGDSAVIITKGKKDVILIDTGGIRNTLVSNNVILYLKSQGIKRIDTLILTHGDFDHMGDAENIITKMKVKKVILNKSLDNELEISLIQKLKKENIPYTHEPQNISLANGQIIFLNKKIFSEENDDSNVLLLELDNKKILFMGDASKDTEEYLINTYNLPKIDILKVGHHGSKTSSSNGFITQIKPYYAVISVGRNNIYHHPNEEVLVILKNSTIYRTDEKGSIIFKLKKNKLKITTYYGKELN